MQASSCTAQMSELCFKLLGSLRTLQKLQFIRENVCLISSSVAEPQKSKVTHPLLLLYHYEKVEKQFLTNEVFDWLNTRAKMARDQQQNLYHEAEQRLHRKYSPQEMITLAASYDLSTLYYHENVKNDILVLTVDPPNPEILREWMKLSEPLQNYIMSLFEAIDVCVGIFIQQYPEVTIANYAAMIDDKMIEAPVKHPTEVAKLVLN